MDVGTVYTMVTDLFNCTAKQASYVHHLRGNLECLRMEMELLIRRSETVEHRVKLAKQRLMTPTREVEGWLEDVQEEKTPVGAVLQQGDALLAKNCLGRCWNIRSSYRLAKRVNQKIMQVRELRSRGDFEEVAYGVPRAVVDELPLGETVGLDSLYTEVCSCLAEEEVRVVELYGRPGIGKTTLLKKINNGLLGTDHQFDIVIWVSVEETASEKAAQEVIGNKLGIVDDIWPNRSQKEKAIQIFNFIKTKTFLLLLDISGSEPLDLSEIGVPLPDARNRSKVIYACCLRLTCILMKADRRFEVKPLPKEYAWSLFINHLSVQARDLALNNRDIEILAENILTKCEGLPLAIIKAGQASADFLTAEEWQQSTRKLEDPINKEISGKDDSLSGKVLEDEMPVGYTVGMDSLSAEVCRCLANDEVGILGFYGKHGIGKTTLMKKINNAILKTDHQFDTVIWVADLEILSEQDAQEVIRNKLGIIDSIWAHRSQDEKAIKIFNVMKTKIYLLFLDNVVKPLDLLHIGVPLHNTRTGSKVIIASRSREICVLMKAERLFEVKPLERAEAWHLFIQQRPWNTRDSVNDNPEIKILAESILFQCKGLPSAIIKAGQASAGLKTATEWQQSIQKLDNLINREISSVLKDKMPVRYSVGLDSLSEEVRSCLANDEVGILGLHGKPRIGKTKLMKKILRNMPAVQQFDRVIWVTVSEEACVSAAQEVIGNNLRIIDSIWPNRSPEEKAIQIFNVLKTKRFLLLLDNVMKPLDLLGIGVPNPDTQEGSKVIISARSRDICICMKAVRLFEVKPLERTDAWNLFIQQRPSHTRDSVNDNPEIKILAQSILAQCEGLPSTIIIAGQASAGFETLIEWQQSKQKLEDLINREILSVKDDRLSHEVVADEMPVGYTVGLDSLHVRVRKCLTEFKGGIIGLYGTGGVGKTTLMKKIYNEFSKTNYPFDLVIWVDMSNSENVKAALEETRTKLQIPDSTWQSRTVEGRWREIFKIMRTKTFLLLLDDVWQRIDLLKIGVPPLHEVKNSSKIIITTRLQKICNEMEVPIERQFKVNFLTLGEALLLFLEKVGKNTLNSHPHIQKLAERVAERCKGLPLALIVVGRAMADKKSPEAWEQAIQDMEKLPTEIPGIEDEVFHVLKFSYDSLKDDITKSCFVYFSFFPKGYEIRNDELIEHWIGEGFIDGDDIHEARRQGHKIIDNLKNACLFEEGDGFKECIKMHDVIHDMALWTGQECGKMMKNILIYESLDIADAERKTSWNKAKTILLWGKNIEKLPETPHWSNLQTLFVRECIQLKTFPKEFFRCMPLLKVLDLSATHGGLTKLPDGIEKLVNLEYINLSLTYIKMLPNGIGKLKKLRCLLLDGMFPLIIPPHVISNLSSLQLFSMYDGNALSGYRASLVEELGSIEALNEISLSFRSVVALNKLLTSPKLQRCMRRLSIYDCEDLLVLVLSSVFLNYLEALVISNCLHLEEMTVNVEKERREEHKQSYDIPNLDLIMRNNQHFHRLHDVKIWSCPKLLNLTWLIYATHLQSLNIHLCKSMKEVIGDEYISSSMQNSNIFTRLRSLVVGAMPMLESICHGTLLFPLLEIISVINCPGLRRLPFDPNGVPMSLKKIEGDLTWWESLNWDGACMEEQYVVYFSPQYLADPVHLSEEEKGKKKLVIEGSTSTTTT